MTDQEQTNEPFDAEQILQREEQPAPKRRGPGRPRKTENLTVNLDGNEEDKPRRGRRSRKLSAENVTDMICASGNLAAMMTQHSHWLIHPEETKPYAGELADLLNKIPSQYVKGFVDLNGYVIIALGLYQTYGKRLQAEMLMQRDARIERQNARTRNPYDGNPETLDPNNAVWEGPHAD